MLSWQNEWIDCIRFCPGALSQCPACSRTYDSFLCLSVFERLKKNRNSMHRSRGGFAIALLATLLIAPVAYAESNSGVDAGGTTFEFGHQDLQSLQFSRQADSETPTSEIQTELSFKLSPGTFDFSSAGAFGLSGVFSNPELEIISRPSGRYRIQQSFPDLHNGLSYSAGIKIEHEDKDLADTVYVSSGQLGLSYGRLGQVWYSGVDLSIGQFSSLNTQEHSAEIVSLDITTGRKLGLTGVGPHAPLWLFSLQGNFDIQTSDAEHRLGDTADWYLNPSLFWQNPDFTFAAQLQVPVDSDVFKDFEEPDYRLRALFEKHFR